MPSIVYTTWAEIRMPFEFLLKSMPMLRIADVGRRRIANGFSRTSGGETGVEIVMILGSAWKVVV